jgi:hypothetical protein
MDECEAPTLELWRVDITSDEPERETPMRPLRLLVYASDEDAVFVCAQVLCACYR